MRYLISNSNLFHIVLEAGKSKVKVLADLVSDGYLLFWFLDGTVLLCPHMVEGREGLSGVYFMKGPNLFHKDSNFMMTTSLNVPPPNNGFTFGISISPFEFWEDVNFQTLAMIE
jgi:hypothetical protein